MEGSPGQGLVNSWQLVIVNMFQGRSLFTLVLSIFFLLSSPCFDSFGLPDESPELVIGLEDCHLVQKVAMHLKTETD